MQTTYQKLIKRLIYPGMVKIDSGKRPSNSFSSNNVYKHVLYLESHEFLVQGYEWLKTYKSLGKTLQSPSLPLVKPRKDMNNVRCRLDMPEILLKAR